MSHFECAYCTDTNQCYLSGQGNDPDCNQCMKCPNQSIAWYSLASILGGGLLVMGCVMLFKCVVNKSHRINHSDSDLEECDANNSDSDLEECE
jgi:hypothetical protein